jgi:hypothetical protein
MWLTFIGVLSYFRRIEPDSKKIEKADVSLSSFRRPPYRESELPFSPLSSSAACRAHRGFDPAS